MFSNPKPIIVKNSLLVSTEISSTQCKTRRRNFSVLNNLNTSACVCKDEDNFTEVLKENLFHRKPYCKESRAYVYTIHNVQI